MRGRVSEGGRVGEKRFLVVFDFESERERERASF
jgi:hypothetical protein